MNRQLVLNCSSSTLVECKCSTCTVNSSCFCTYYCLRLHCITACLLHEGRDLPVLDELISVRLPGLVGGQSEEDDDGWEEREASRAHSVKFTEDVEPESGKETPFVRQNTPHPKELKAKAHKLFNKSKLSDNLTEEDEQKVNDSKGGSFRSERLSSAEVEASSERSSLTYSESTLPRETDSVKEQAIKKKEEESSGLDGPDKMRTPVPTQPPPPPYIPNNDLDDGLCEEMDGRLDIQEERLEVRLEKTNASLGLSIAGGLGSTPFKGDDIGIFVSRVTEGGPADKADLKVGDKIISVNGVSMVGIDHHDAVQTLRTEGPVLNMVIAREVAKLLPIKSPSPLHDRTSTASPSSTLSTSRPPSSVSNRDHSISLNGPTLDSKISSLKKSDYDVQLQTIHTTLIRDQNGLGFSIAGGKGSPQFRENSDAIYISRITEGGVAEKDGKLQVGDRIISINGVDVEGARHDQAVTMLTCLERFVRLVVERELLVPKGTASPPQTSSPKLLGNASPKPYTSLYNVNRQIANRPGMFRTSAPADPRTAPPPSPPRPAPRRAASQSSESSNASHPTEEVTLIKDGGPLGLSITGGTDHSCIPFGGDKPGIFISHIVAGGTAAASGKLRMGDRLLEVNGEDLTKCRHEEAVMALLKPTEQLKLLIQHDPLPEGFQVLKIVREEGEKLGMHIKGGLRGHRGNPLDKNDEGVFISKINSGGAAKRDGRLKVGMRLLEVNGVSLIGSTHQDAVNTLRTAGLSITLVVCKGYDKSEVERLMAEGVLSKETKSASHSVSSLDREEENSEHHKQENDIKEDEVFEKEEEKRPEKEIVNRETAVTVPATTHLTQAENQVDEHKPKSTPEKVMDVVRAVENITINDMPTSPSAKPKSPKAGDSLKTTTIVMSKHTLAPQPSDQSTNNVNEVKPSEPKASVSDKKKFFEKAMEEQTQPSPKPERVFSFLNADEVEKLKQEEEKKIASLSRTELKALSRVDEDADPDEVIENEIVKQQTITPPGTRKAVDGLLNMGSIRTAKAERRMKERLIQEGLLSDDDEKDLSPAEQRARKAEKRAAWRQARLKSLEQDALQAQIVIKKMSEMIDSKNIGFEDDTDATIINNNQAIMDHENNMTPEVETRKEKIISLELSAPEVDVEIDPDEPTSPTTPTSDSATSINRKKKRKKSKKGKH